MKLYLPPIATPIPSHPIPIPSHPTHCPNAHPNPNAQSHTHPNAHCPIPTPIDHCQKRKFLFLQKLKFVLHKIQKGKFNFFTKIEICYTNPKRKILFFTKIEICYINPNKEIVLRINHKRKFYDDHHIVIFPELNK